MFSAGPDGRRYKHDEERRKARMTIESLAKEYTQEAFDKLVALVNSDNPKIALEAVTQVLDRGHGRSIDRLAIQTIGSGTGDISSADPETLLRVLSERTMMDDAQVLEHDTDD
jgi:hypothetical protein